jgi:hypothetical protein
MSTKKSDCKKSGRADRKPGSARYHRLGFPKMRLRKIHNLMECCGMTREAATETWERTRQRRPTYDPTYRPMEIQGPNKTKKPKKVAA